MYLDYWRLREEPFKNSLDERFAFMSPQHKEAVARLTYAARQQKEGALLTGDYGTGKSLVRKIFIKELVSLGNFAVALIENPLDAPERIIDDVFKQLSGHAVASGDPLPTLGDLSNLIENRRSNGIHHLVVIEEAQLLKKMDHLEYLRLLMNLVDKQGSLMLTLIFIGQLDLIASLQQSPGLLQRLATRWNITPFSIEQTKEYISQRLSIAGANGWIFDDSAVEALFAFSGGIARVINNVADMSLYLGMCDKTVHIDASIVNRVATDWKNGISKGDS